MTSIHIHKAIEKARSKGAAAGGLGLSDLWALPKRELLEAALHLAALSTESYDEAMAHSAVGAATRLREEIAALRKNGLL